MQSRILRLLVITMVLSTLMIGCQQAAKKPYTDNNNNVTNTEMTENERRVMAGRLSDMAEKVEGVKKASVIVSSIGITQDTNVTMPDATTNNNNVTNSNDATDTGLRTNMPANPAGRITNPRATDINTPDTNVGNRINTNMSDQNGLVVMVGLTLNNNIMDDAAKVKSIKQTVANRLQGEDSRISQILVSSDPDLMKRINNVAAGLLEGKPIKNFENELKQLSRDLKQEMPAL